MHETMIRLYQAAKELKNIEGQSALARYLDATPQTLKNWESRGISSQGMIHACQALEINIEWLKTGNSIMRPIAAPAFDNNVNLSHKYALHKIPIISWVQAGNWRQIELSPDLEYIEITTPVRDGYGLRVQGDSMMPEFVQGDIIVVSPHAQPENGSYVIVVQEGDEATFKKLVYDGAKPYFKPLNPQYPMLEANEHTRIVGVVKQKIKTY